MSEKYREAGVDIDAANESVSQLKEHVERTRRPGVLGALGGFGGLFSLKDAGFGHVEGDEVILVSGTDGVGTKLKLAIECDRHDTIGIDCVAMCVNDVLTTGAAPLFFLDYIATGKLEPAQITAIVSGIATGCVESECALIGGETAEMPGFYPGGDYDVAGFCVGAAYRSRLLDSRRNTRANDTLIAFEASGVHSNGYSLVRKIIADHAIDIQTQAVDGVCLADLLLEPTRLYVKGMRELREGFDVVGAAHITGGGLIENLPRMLSEDLAATIDTSTWELSPLYEFLVEKGELTREEAMRVFNVGVGFVVAVRGDVKESKLEELSSSLGYRVWKIGELSPRVDDAVILI